LLEWVDVDLMKVSAGQKTACSFDHPRLIRDHIVAGLIPVLRPHSAIVFVSPKTVKARLDLLLLA
jgi:hypothetical protein